MSGATPSAAPPSAGELLEARQGALSLSLPTSKATQHVKTLDYVASETDFKALPSFLLT